MIYNGDAADILWLLGENTCDALITDPPAGISFMGKSWDDDKGGRDEWVAWLSGVMREALRVLKPGAHGLVWSLPRTSHWTGTALEAAGFEIRDVITHLFGQGFPKSLDVSKAIDKAAGVKREVIGKSKWANRTPSGCVGLRGNIFPKEKMDTAANTDAARQWAGWGTALKPAAEFWWLIRKPLSEKTVAVNVLKWGTGAINIDGSRIGFASPGDKAAAMRANADQNKGRTGYGRFENGPSSIAPYIEKMDAGRFPAHLVLDEDAAAMLDEQSGELRTGAKKPHHVRSKPTGNGETHGKMAAPQGEDIPASTGGASRFFYCAKVSTGERGKDNRHPTVKPLKLMRYFAKLITPPKGIILDPFAGSGSTGVAALQEGFGFIGIEKEAEYAAIARARFASFRK